MPRERNKSGQLNLRIDPTIKELAERAAADDYRSLANLIDKLLIDYLRVQGFSKKSKKTGGKE